MGADLIVFIAVGPIKLPKRSIDKALKRALKIQDAARKLLDLYTDKDQTAKIVSKADRIWDSELFHGLRSQVALDELSEAETYLRDIADEDLNVLLGEYVTWWATAGGRDTACRMDPYNKNRQIVVCGDMSWGDSPTGLGYTLMDKAYWFDIPQSLGIK